MTDASVARVHTPKGEGSPSNPIPEGRQSGATENHVNDFLIASGAVILAAILLLASLELSALMLNETNEIELPFEMGISDTPPFPSATLSISNAGDASVAIPPVATPLLNLSGFYFDLAPNSSFVTQASESSEVMKVSIGGSSSRLCTPALTLANTSAKRYARVTGLNPFGPTELSFVFSPLLSKGPQSTGILFGSNYSTLVELEVDPANESAFDIVLESYNPGNGSLYDVLARSSTFAVREDLPTLLTVNLTVSAGFTVSVDGVVRLAGLLPSPNSYPGTLGIWGAANLSIYGLYESANGAIAWGGSEAQCGTLTSLPLECGASPSAIGNGPLVEIRQGLSESGGTTYSSTAILEAFQSGESLAQVEVTGCQWLDLSPGQSSEFTAPMAY